MRILLSVNSKKVLLGELKQKYSCNSFAQLSKKLEIPKSTLEDWLKIPGRYIPESIVPEDKKKKLEILDIKEDNWGRKKGGKKTYNIILRRYGKKEIERRRKKGTINSLASRGTSQDFKIDIKNKFFLEFYGILIGDGWLGEYFSNKKKSRIIGISGHREKDRDFFFYCQRNIHYHFNRKAYFKEKPAYNAIELQISHKKLFEFLYIKLNFPVGRKGTGLKIHPKFLSFGFNHTKHIIKGIFDTDGSIYFDKTPAGNPYPCISIQMKAPELIKQIYEILIQNGFKVTLQNIDNQKSPKITLKGKKQLDKWIAEIGSSNPRHSNKMSL